MIGIIDYGLGNLASVYNSISRFSDCLIIQDPSQIAQLSGIVLPGVGNFGSAINRVAKFKRFLGEVPTLGICLGFQLMLETSAEGNCSGLGLIQGKVLELPTRIKPQIGWYPVRILDQECPLLNGLPSEHYFYFAHSYYVLPSNPNQVKAIVDYAEFQATAMVQSGNLYGVQFHPEKSGELGLKLIQNFCQLCIQE